jgi:hypothetical protein
MKADLAQWYDEAVDAARSPVSPQAPPISAD